MEVDNALLTIKFETGSGTHTGRVRQVNEDSYLARPDIGLWAVADGVGGYVAGQLASQAVVADLDTLGPAVSHVDQVARFEERIHRANDRIGIMMAERGGAPMGSTVASVLIFNLEYTCAWSGDSRIYLVRDGEIRQVTKDHSEVQELVDQGALTPEQARTWPRRNVITHAVGIFDDPGLDIVRGKIKPGDTFVVCSDGLTGHLNDLEICSVVDANRPQRACDLLIEETLERGATDNVSVIVVRCHRGERTNFFPGSSTAAAAPGEA